MNTTFDQSETNDGKNSPGARNWALLVTLLGLVVTLSGGLLTWYASSQATKQAAAESCIQRVDKQELVIRDKAEALLGSVAAFSSKAASPDVTEQSFHQLGEAVVDSAMRFMAYAPLELTAVAAQLAGTVQVGLMARTPEEQNKALQLSTTAMKGWATQYFTLMDKYDKRRSDCLN
ncbi:hypothetical protein [Pseudomonas mediterranea]|uniref:hypothetical protein n=1 Tax=Pseudomonas mediterranea TaxID=183795 RepID=UPI0006D88F3D|nr:hypothetical protein [Pseudomonas mediterranea]